jgi:hypothetical protein
VPFDAGDRVAAAKKVGGDASRAAAELEDAPRRARAEARQLARDEPIALAVPKVLLLGAKQSAHVRFVGNVESGVISGKAFAPRRRRGARRLHRSLGSEPRGR